MVKTSYIKENGIYTEDTACLSMNCITNSNLKNYDKSLVLKSSKFTMFKKDNDVVRERVDEIKQLIAVLIYFSIRD